MRQGGIYMIQTHIVKCRYSQFSIGDVVITLRIGRSSTSIIHHIQQVTSQANIDSYLQLNIDSIALDTQRCSITLTSSANKRIIGIALISLPKDKDSVENTYRLTQSEDKRSEVEIKIKIIPITSYQYIQDSPKKQSTNAIKVYSGVATMNDSRLKWKTSIDKSEEQNKSLNFNSLKDDDIDEIKQSQTNILKDEKDAYYQLYQIQKSKNQFAMKFISIITRKIQEKFPQIELPKIASSARNIQVIYQRRPSKQNQIAKIEQGRIQQLQQANRSLHRQIDQYKKIIDQLKGSVGSKIRQPNLAIPRNAISSFDLRFQSKSNILLSQFKIQEEKTNIFAEVDLRRWLEESVGQRQKCQQFLKTLLLKEKQPEKPPPNIRKLRTQIDRAYTNLFVKKELTRAGVLSHKQQINRIFDQLI